MSYWSAQVLVLLFAWQWSKRELAWHLRFNLVHFESLKSMMQHGFNLQFNELMYFVHFQFDKMIIAGFAGLTEVAHYEVASRAGQALRSLPFTAITTFLPTATEKLAKGEDIWPSYIEMTRAASLAAVMLLLLPLAVSPIFLFAWVGQIGYHGRWVFMLLAIGISISILAMPVSNFIQAMGRTVVDAKFAIISVTINVVLSLLLIQIWGKEGAAAGTGLAMLITGFAYMNNFHNMNGRRLMDTIDYLVKMLWPALLVCLICFGLERIIEPWVISSRWYMGPAAVLLYLFGLVLIITVMLATERLGQQERALLAKIPFVRHLPTMRSSYK
jgi:O-antigen/teichoic acid export membrane protein